MNVAPPSVIRVLSLVLAALLVAATVISLGLAFDLFVKPPEAAR